MTRVDQATLAVVQMHMTDDLQDNLRLAADWRATLGARAEKWQAFDGALANAARAASGESLRFGERNETSLSPKAALS